MIPARRDFSRAVVRLTVAVGLAGVALLATLVGGALDAGATIAPPDPSADIASETATPTLTLDTVVVDFGITLVGRESDVVVVTVTVSGGPVDDVSTEVTGPFLIDEDCGMMVDGESCPIEITFVPTSSGSTGGELAVVAGTARVTAGLRGMGVDALPIGPTLPTAPSFTIPPITAGPTVISPITIAPTVVPPTNAPSTTVPPITPTTSSPVETRDECDARALGAEISYSPELEMTVGESVRIDAIASIGGDNAPDPTIAGPSTVVVPQQLQCQVRARLVGGEEFTTNPEDWQEGSFLGTSEISWRWVVTPQVAGDGLFLVLQVQGLRFDADVGGFVPAGESFTEEAQIRVDSRPRGVVSRLNDAVSGVVTHPLVAFAGAGGLVVLLRWGLQQRRSKDAAGNADDRPPT